MVNRELVSRTKCDEMSIDSWNGMVNPSCLLHLTINPSDMDDWSADDKSVRS